MSEPEITAALERDGFALVPRLVGVAVTEKLIDCLPEGNDARSERAGDVYGARNLLSVPPVRQVVRSAPLRDLIRATVGDTAQAVRAIYFDKTPNANGPVAWHQDLSLALSQRREVPGWSNWTVKRGIPHAQAPAGVLERMATVRVHLDDCSAENGPLRVIAGSHRHGILSRNQIQSAKEARTSPSLTANRGDVLLMRPLLLHASSPAQNPLHRRVLHIEFAPTDVLPQELSWAEVA